MATRRTDIRRGGIDLATILTDKENMTTPDGKLQLPTVSYDEDGNLDSSQLYTLKQLDDTLTRAANVGADTVYNALEQILSHLMVTSETVEGITEYSLRPKTDLVKFSLGTESHPFKSIRAEAENSVWIGNKKLSVNPQSGDLTVSDVDTQTGIQTVVATLSAESLKQEVQTALLANPTDSSSFVAQIAAEVNTGAQGPEGPAGQDGKSAYQAWLDLNNTGTEQEFIDSLQGADGQPGQDAVSPASSDVASALALDSSFVNDLADEAVLKTEVSTSLANNLTFRTAVKGDQGDVGPAGAAGQAGLSAYQVWQQEDPANASGTEQDFLNSLKGNDGQPGSQGTSGLSAYDVWFNLLGNSGTEQDFIDSLQGADGQPGSIGLTGQPGDQGIPGVAGTAGVSVSSATVDSSGDLILTLSDNTQSNAGNVIGPQGNLGPQGDPGPKGDTGEAGPQGSIGLTGPVGPKGDKFSVDITQPLNKTLANAAQANQSQSYFYLVTADQRTTDPFDLIDSLTDSNSTINHDVSGHLLMWAYSAGSANGINGYWTDLGKMAGVKGDQGDPGPQGDLGPVGPAGPQGDAGQPGSAGVDADNAVIANTLITSSTFQDLVADSSVRTLGADITSGTGVFTTWNQNTSLGVALNDLNQVLSNLTPKKAPGLSEADEYLGTSTSGSDGKLSLPASHTPVDGAISPFGAVAKDAEYSFEEPTSSNSNTRIGIVDGTTNITGELNTSVIASGNSYARAAFSDAKLGTLFLYLNGVQIASEPLDTTSSIVRNGSASGFNLTAPYDAQYENGASFDLFNYRTGSYTILSNQTGLLDGWNYLQIKHDLGDGSDVRESEIIEWYRDTNTEAIVAPTSNFTPAFDDNTKKKISGVEYYTSGSLNYSVDLDNVYKNTYSKATNAISFNASSQLNDITENSIPALSGDDETKTISLTRSSISLKNNQVVCNGSLTVSTTVQHPAKPTVTVGSQSVLGVLFNNKNESTDDLTEDFEGESKRISYDASVSGSVDQTALANLPVFDSDVNLTSAEELVVFNEQLVYGKQDYNFANSPSGNADYSSFSGEKYYVRKFANTTSSISQNFSIKLTGIFTLKSATSASLSGNDIKVFIKVPPSNNDTSALGTAWMDVFSASPSVPQWTDNEGMRSGSISISGTSYTIPLTMGTRYIPSSEAILVKIQAPDSWSGSISQIQIIWG